MCIALITTAHPSYPFILLNNRDEFLLRPTAPADFWPEPHTNVLGGRDLQRPEQGTWLGLTTSGHIAVLTNFRESGTAVISGVKSRGGLPKAFLTGGDIGVGEFARHMVEDVGVSDVGGFSLAFGKLRKGMFDGEERGLAIISNRTDDVDAVTWICGREGETQGLSNSHFGDRTWPKVVEGEEALKRVVDAHAQGKGTKDELVEQLIDVLSTDTLPQRKKGEDWETYVYQLRNSIFIPRVGGEEVEESRADEIATADMQKTAKTNTTRIDGGSYGTQKQTVILVDRNGKATYIEKTLYDEHGRPLEYQYAKYEFDIQGWDE